MANWYGTCRSNYFRVKDVDAFRVMLAGFEATEIEKEIGGETHYGFISDDEYGDIPQTWYDEDGDDLDDPVNITDCIADHLADGEVCIVMVAGAEKARYITGYALAIHSSGEIVNLSLSDIYQIAAEKFTGASITEATY